MANQQRGGSGNFANDPERASEEGKKGAQNSIRNPAVPKISKAAEARTEGGTPCARIIGELESTTAIVSPGKMLERISLFAYINWSTGVVGKGARAISLLHHSDAPLLHFSNTPPPGGTPCRFASGKSPGLPFTQSVHQRKRSHPCVSKTACS